MKLGIVYSGERLEPRSFRALGHVASVMKEDTFEITQLIDAASGDKDKQSEDRQRVKKVAKFLRLDPEWQSHPDFTSVEALIVEIGSNPRETFQIGTLLSEAVDARVHLYLPYDALTLLRYEEVIDLFARAASKNVCILGCSRFLFGECYTRVRESITSFEFGGIRDALFRIGIGPVADRRHLLTFIIHHLNICFDLLPDKKPIEMAVVTASVDPFTQPQPCFNFTMRYAGGEIANFFLTSNRLWSDTSYHWIEISGSNAYAATDLITRRYRTGIDPGTQISEINDDTQGPVIFGTAGKLQNWIRAAETDVSQVTDFSKITQRSLWVYRTLKKMLDEMFKKGIGIDTRIISATDTSDGWPE